MSNYIILLFHLQPKKRKGLLLSHQGVSFTRKTWAEVDDILMFSEMGKRVGWPKGQY